LILSPHRPTETESFLSRPWCDGLPPPSSVMPDRKRKLSISSESEGTSQKSLKLEAANSASRISFDDTMDVEGKQVRGEPDSSEEEDTENRFRVDIVPSPSPVGDTITSPQLERRRMFARSKSEKTCCSMPIPVGGTLSFNKNAQDKKERRKSMPSNMKMPIIKVTPSSPSPDPFHPDYPEFFEDRLYLEHLHNQQKVQEPVEPEAQGDFDNFTLVLEEGNTDDEEENDKDVTMEDTEANSNLAEAGDSNNNSEHDTPELEDILHEAEETNAPGHVIKIIRQEIVSTRRPLSGKIHLIVDK